MMYEMWWYFWNRDDQTLDSRCIRVHRADIRTPPEHTFGIIPPCAPFELPPPRSEVPFGGRRRRDGISVGGRRRKGLLQRVDGRLRLAGHHDDDDDDDDDG